MAISSSKFLPFFLFLDWYLENVSPSFYSPTPVAAGGADKILFALLTSALSLSKKHSKTSSRKMENIYTGLSGIFVGQ